VASYSDRGIPLCQGQLAVAARDVADRATAVGIVTGFAIAGAVPVAAETDGPPGALFLARALVSLGIDVLLIADRYATPLLAVGCDRCGLPRSILREFPLEDSSHTSGQGMPGTPRADAWVNEFWRSDAGSRLSHLISVEHVGPSHTHESFLMQRRNGPIPLDDFQRDVPPESRDVCHNMRGTPIDALTGRAHRLFDLRGEHRQAVTTIGIGDGGNEIGMGSIPWEALRSAVTVGPAGRVACRVATDHTLLAGVSDWASYALACSVLRLRGITGCPPGWDEAGQRALIEALVRDAGAVDGVTARREASVDGLPLETYLQVFSGIRALAFGEPGM